MLDEAAVLIRATAQDSLRTVLAMYLPWAIALNLLIVPWQQQLAGRLHPPLNDVLQLIAATAVVMVLDTLLLRQFVRGMLFAQGAAAVRGLRVTRRQAMQHALRRLPAAALATLLTGGLFGGSILLAISMAAGDPFFVGLVFITLPLTVLASWLIVILGYVAIPVVQLERRGPMRALVRSARLCRSRPWTVAGVAVIVAIVHIASLLVTSVASSLWVQSALSTAVSALLAVFDVAVELHLYYSLRCSRENLDLELLAQEVATLDADEVVEKLPSAPLRL